jgi:hypothetical protein
LYVEGRNIGDFFLKQFTFSEDKNMRHPLSAYISQILMRGQRETPCRVQALIKGARLEHRKLAFVNPQIPVEGKNPEDLKNLRRNKEHDLLQ